MLKWQLQNTGQGLSIFPKRWVVTLTIVLTACSLSDVPTNVDDNPLPLPTELESEMLEQVNAARQAGYDCGKKGSFAATTALKLEPRLSTAAQTHADDMNVQNYFSHTAPDGSTVGTRVTRTGYLWIRVGENIARGYRDVDDVMRGWLESDGHCANLMNPRYTALGVGKSGDYWVQVFARAR